MQAANLNCSWISKAFTTHAYKMMNFPSGSTLISLQAPSMPVDASRFLDVAKSLPKSILSLGWTTAYDSNSNGSYESSQIQEMIDVIRSHNITQEITFPVRAGLAARSLEQLTNLTESIEKSTLTIWSSDGDNVSVEDLRLLCPAIFWSSCVWMIFPIAAQVEVLLELPFGCRCSWCWRAFSRA
ncbi:hypothetical protein HUJ04_005280 [Dendroctonus ponderosae]|nr:hypothetical protein HUJ04_005280 [Dendroctonus ponderosae]